MQINKIMELKLIYKYDLIMLYQCNFNACSILFYSSQLKKKQLTHSESRLSNALIFTKQS